MFWKAFNMIHTLVSVPCAHCDDIVIKLVIRYPGWCNDERACLWPGFDSRKVLVVPIQQTGFFLCSHSASRYIKSVIRTATISGN